MVEISADLNILSFPDDHKESIPVLVRSQNVPNKYNYWLFLHETGIHGESPGLGKPCNIAGIPLQPTSENSGRMDAWLRGFAKVFSLLLQRC